MAWSSSSKAAAATTTNSLSSPTSSDPLHLTLDKSRFLQVMPTMTSTTATKRTTTTTTSLLAAKIPSGGAISPKDSDDDDDNKDATATSSVPARYRWSVLAILTSAFLNLLGFTMAGPITPALGQHFELPVGASFGSLTSAYPLGMLGGLFVWPSLSDTIGRKPVLVLSLLGSGIGLALQSQVIRSGGSLALFLASRVATGCFAGSSPVSKAFLADVGAASGQLPRYLAWRDACSTLAFIVGPLLGGIALDAREQSLGGTSSITSSLAFVIGISSAASLAASALIALSVKDVEPSLKKGGNNAMNKIRKRLGVGNFNNDNDVLSCPLGNDIWSGVLTVCFISFLFNVGDSTFHAFFSALLKHSLNYPAKTIGLAYTIFACVSFGISTSIVSKAISKFGPVRICSAGLTAISLGLYGLAASGLVTTTTSSTASSLVVWPAAILYYIGVPLYGPTIPTMLLRCVPPNQRGRVMGLDGGINTLARILSPLIMGWLYQKYGSSIAFGVAGLATLSGAIIALLRRLLVLWKQQEENEKQQQQQGGARVA